MVARMSQPCVAFVLRRLALASVFVLAFSVASYAELSCPNPLSFPKIASRRISAMVRNQRMIRHDAADPHTTWDVDRQPFSVPHEVWSLGAAATQPLFDGGMRRRSGIDGS